MKSIYLYLVLVIGMMTTNQASGQQTKSINYKMKLNAVPVKTSFLSSSDKLLVRSSDKILKEVDKSLVFNSTAASTPDLQTVLANGNTYTGNGNYSENYMQLSNGYPFSEKITFSTDKGLEFEAGTIAKTRIHHGAFELKYNNFTVSIVAPTDGNSGGSGVLTLPATNGTLTAIMQGQPANPNNFGKLGLMMTDGNYLYICLSQGVWKKILLSNL